ncbi:hypothetical protein GO988_17985 [Hymenobacter sp. HMF4947]|uniref:STAS/SEC14 domain-containing protein n=1 Tax=Hymenobacter ginkgonis TaxID=2682976 RepID=A0A7K1TIM2_9BACT|nr:hypothetical protein [Hymenobacter ginkgonis]MVN78223.1 hypothetical protein [Hymenobacter ginkgonis]
MQPSPPTIFSLDFDAASKQLVGRWLHDTDNNDLYPSYERLLAAAQAHGKCRFWLLDMRQRSWQPASFAQWMSDLLARKVVRELGSPVFVAYVAAESLREAIESTATEAMLRQVAQAEFYPYFFSDEGAARDWLLYYQTHPEQKPSLQHS